MPQQSSYLFSNWISRWFVEPKRNGSDRQIKPSPDLLLLEDRVLYSASPIPVEMVDAADGGSLETNLFEAIDQQFVQLDAILQEGSFDWLESSFEATVNAEIDNDVSLQSFSGSESTDLKSNHEPLLQATEIAFIDASIDGHEQLIEDLRQSTRNIEIVILNPDTNGLQAISDQLLKHADISAIHLVTHGQDGELRLGNQTIGHAELETYAEEFSSWRAALSADADLILYGCDIAETSYGERFVNELSHLTMLDIAASNDITGHHQLGGDWSFEYVVGSLESDIAFSRSIVESWTATLPAPVIPTGVSDIDVPLGGGKSFDHDVGSDFFGNTIVVHSSSSFPTSNQHDIYLTRYNTAGNEVVSNQRINEFLNGNQRDVSVAVNDYGEFAVVWTTDISGTDTIKGKFFNRDGSVLVSEFFVSEIGETASNAVVGISDSGEIIVSWQGSGTSDANGIYAKRFDLNGDSASSILAINSATVGEELGASVAMNARGEWIVGWYEFENDNTQNQVVFSVYDANDTRVLDNVVAHDFVASVFSGVDVDIDDDRNFAILATSAPLSSLVAPPNLNDEIAQSVKLNVYAFDGDWDADIDGNFRSSPESTPGNTNQFGGSVELRNGQALLAWEGQATDGSDDEGVFLATIDFDGGVDGGVVHVGGVLADFQSSPILASFHDDAEYALIWADENGGISKLKLRVSATFTNTLPSTADASFDVSENGRHVIQLANLGYTDNETPLNTLRIETIPVNGVLFVNGEAVVVGQTIDVEDINNGSFVFAPNHNYLGSSAFTFTANDGFSDAASSSTISFVVEAKADESPIHFGDQLFTDTGGVIVNEGFLAGDQTEHQVEALRDSDRYVVVFKDSVSGNLIQRLYEDDNNSIGYSSITGSLPGNHRDPAVASLADGGYVITWTHSSGLASSIVGLRFHADGSINPVNGSNDPFTVFAQDDVNQFESDVAGLDNGSFVVTWTTGSSPGGDELDISAKIIDVNGGSNGEFRVNTAVLGTQRDSTVEALDGNKFVVGWVDHTVNDFDVKARVFEAGDPSSGTEFTLTTNSTMRQGDLQLTRLDNGNFLALWDSTGALDGAGRGVFGTLFDGNGDRVIASEFIVNEAPAGHQSDARAVAQNGGGFTVFFQSTAGINSGDPSGTSIIGRTFDAAGSSTTGDQLIQTFHYGDQQLPAVTRLHDGEIVLTYQAQDGDHLGIDNADGTNDYGYGIYRQIIRNSATVTEGSTTPIALNAFVVDAAHTYDSIRFSNIPTGVVFTDGVNTSSGNVAIEIKDWNLSNLSMVLADGFQNSFSIDFDVQESDGSDSNSYSKMLFFDVVNIDSVVSKPDFAVATNANTTADISFVQLVDGLVDADLRLPSHAPIDQFSYSTLPPSENSTHLTWQNADNSNQIELDKNHVSYVDDPTETIPALRGQFQFDGNGGGTIGSRVTLDQAATFELWVRPDSLSGERLILEGGGDEGGFAIYQVDDQIEVRMVGATQAGLPDSEPYVLVAEGLSTSSFTQISFTFGAGLTPANPNQLDAMLYINGELADHLTDIPSWESNVSLGSVDHYGLAQQVGSVAGQDATDFFAGAIANVQFFEAEFNAVDAQTYYLNTLNTALPMTADGTALSAGAMITLPSNATITVGTVGQLTYDPNGQFDGLAVGETASDAFVYRVQNGLGEFDLVTVTVEITGVNEAPVIDTIPDYLTTEDTGFSDSLTAFVTEIDVSDSLTFSFDSTSASGTIDLQSDGTFSYTPAANFFGTETVSFNVDDGNGGAVTSSFDVVVSSVNDLPTGESRTISLNERTTRTIGLSDFTYADVETTSFTNILIVDGPTLGVLELNGTEVVDGQSISFSDIDNGLLEYTDMESDDVIRFRVFDGEELSTATYEFSMQTIDLPEAPFSQDFNVTIDEDGEHTFVLGDFNFSDPDGDTLDHIIIQATASTGTITLDGVEVADNTTVTRLDIENGRFKFTPVENEFGANYDSFTFVVSDGALESAIFTATIDVSSVNDLPTSLDRTISVDERTSITLNVGDFAFDDVESTEFTQIQIVNTSSTGILRLGAVAVSDGDFVSRLAIQNGDLTYEDNEADDAVVFRVYDGTELSLASYTLTLQTIDLPDAPTSAGFERTIDEDSTYEFLVSDFVFADLDGDTLAYVVIRSLPSDGSLLIRGGEALIGDTVSLSQLADGELVFVPDPDEQGSNYSSFEFAVSDGGLNSADQVVTFHVTSVNDAPESANATRLVNERTSIQLTTDDFPFTDVESTRFTEIQLVTVPSNGTLMLSGSAVSDGDFVSFGDIADGRLTFTDTELDQSITYRVSDGEDISISSYTLTLETVDLPERPTATGFDRTIDEDSSYTIQTSDLNFSDPDGEGLVHLRIESAPSAGRLLLDGVEVFDDDLITLAQLDNGELVFVPDANEHGTNYSMFTFVVSDGVLESNLQTVSISVTSINDLPAASNADFDINERTSRTIEASDFGFSDIESTNFTAIRINAVPSLGQLTLIGSPVSVGDTITFAQINSGQLVYLDAELDTTFEFTVFDGIDFATSSNTFTFTSVDLPENPDARDDMATVLEGGAVTIELFDNDIANATGKLLLSTIESPLHGTIRSNGAGRLRYVHDGSESASDSFTYTIMNSDGLFDTATVFISVSPVDDPTVAVNDIVGTIVNTELELDRSIIMSNDSDPDSDISSMTITMVAAPEHGRIEMRSGTAFYIPDEGFTGNDTFSYQLVNGVATSNVATVTVSVSPVLISIPFDPEPTPTEREEDDNNTTIDEPVVDEPSADDGTTTTTVAGNTDKDTETPSIALIAPVYDEARAQSLDDSDSSQASFIGGTDSLSLDLTAKTYTYQGRSDVLALLDLYSASTNFDPNVVLSEFDSDQQITLFFSDLDTATTSFLSEKLNIGLPEVAFSAASLLTAGFLTRMIHGGIMLTTLVTQTHAYQYFDIASILENGKQESIESIVDQ